MLRLALVGRFASLPGNVFRRIGDEKDIVTFPDQGKRREHDARFGENTGAIHQQVLRWPKANRKDGRRWKA